MNKPATNLRSPQARAQAVEQAIALHQAGKLAEAEAAYMAILKVHPEPDALLNLSTLYSKAEKYDEAAKLLKKLIPLVPQVAYVRFAYGNLLLKMKQNEEALAQFNRAIAIDPSNASFHYNQGVVYDALERFEEAIESYARALELQPTHMEALINRANDFFRRGDFAASLEMCNQAVSLNPSLPLAYTTRGNALGGLGRTEEALADYERAIALDPNGAIAHNNMGNLLKDGTAVEGALASYDRALTLNPNYADAHNNRATALNKLERFADALASAEAAIALAPNSANGYDTRGNALAGLGRFEEALASYDRSLELDPKQVNSYWNKALLALLLGRYEEGWKLYEERWRTEFQKHLYRKIDVAPLWQGEPLEGKTIFVYPEQGYGDFIQFCRYVPLLLARGAKVILETLWPLMPLIEPRFSSDRVRVYPAVPDAPPPPCDYHCPIMSLPHAFGTTLETIPNQIPYLATPPAKIAEWQQRLGPRKAARIGLVWSGAAAHLNDKNRSIPLATLEPLLQLPFEFHSLQKEYRDADLTSMAGLKNHQEHLNDFSDTAALIEAMDLCITVDTSVAHLVGALGKPLWVLLPYTPDYRWLLERQDSPWYPSAALFRQQTRGDWPGLIQELVGLLKSVFG